MVKTVLHKKIPFKLSFILAGILLGISVLREIPIYYYTKNRVLRSLNDLQLDKARYLAQGVDAKIHERVKFLAALSKMITKEKIQEPAILGDLLRAQMDMVDYFPLGFGVISPDGHCLIAGCASLLEGNPITFNKSQWFIQATRKKSVVISKPFKSGAKGDLILVIAAGIHDGTGRLTGVLAAPVLLGHPRFLGNTFENKDNHFSEVLMVLRSDKLFVPSADNRIFQARSNPEMSGLNHKTMEGYNGVGMTPNEFGGRDVYAFAAVPSLDCFVVVRTPSEIAFTPMREEIKKQSFTSVVLIIITVITIFILLNIYFRPLKQAAERVRKMGDNKKLPYLDQKRDDEIGELIIGFNTLVDTVNKRTLEIEKKNRQLKELSQTDGLTKVFNRRWFDLSLAQKWKEQMRRHEPLSLIMLDIDFFKRYNDLYGHPAGDKCLVLIADALTGTLRRASDVFARYGGEEFAAIVSADSASAAQLGETMRRTVQELALKHETAPLGIVTISLGVATLIPNGDTVPENLIAHADKALYESKTTGRNRIAAFTHRK